MIGLKGTPRNLGGNRRPAEDFFTEQIRPKLRVFFYETTRMVIGRRRVVLKVAGGTRMSLKRVLKNPLFTEGSDEDSHNFPTLSSSRAPVAASSSPRAPLGDCRCPLLQASKFSHYRQNTGTKPPLLTAVLKEQIIITTAVTQFMTNDADAAITLVNRDR